MLMWVSVDEQLAYYVYITMKYTEQYTLGSDTFRCWSSHREHLCIYNHMAADGCDQHII